jgi:ATP dependent DNA ligase C terminal region
VIGGYTPSAANFDAVLVGYYDRNRLSFAGKVRAGFTPHLRAEVFRRIADRPARRCPFVNLPNGTGKSRWDRRWDMRAIDGFGRPPSWRSRSSSGRRMAWSDTRSS